MIELSIVIVNWNAAVLLEKCLDSIKRNSPQKDFKVYVVDNASSDNSVRMIKDQFPWVNLIVNRENIGYAKANNKVLKKIKTKYVLILNPDTQITHGALDELLKFFDANPEVGACGPLLLGPDRRIQSRGYYLHFPTLIQVLLFYTQISKISFKSKFLVKKFWEYSVDNNDPIDVDQIPGACFLARYKILKKFGFFDDDYYLWFEDVDLCWKLRNKGFKLKLVPKSKVIHIGGGSFNSWQDERGRQARFFKSLFLFFDKNSNFLISLVVRVIIITNFLYLISTMSIKQLLNWRNDRKMFILNKLRVLKCLLVS